MHSAVWSAPYSGACLHNAEESGPYSGACLHNAEECGVDPTVVHVCTMQRSVEWTLQWCMSAQCRGVWSGPYSGACLHNAEECGVDPTVVHVCTMQRSVEWTLQWCMYSGPYSACLHNAEECGVHSYMQLVIPWGMTLLCRSLVGVTTPDRHVRTRLYFTSQSHVHAVLNVLRYGGLLKVR